MRQKSLTRRSGFPAHEIFQMPFSDILYGVSGSMASVNAAASDSSGIEYVRAGSRLMELTPVFSQSFVSAAGQNPTAEAANMQAYAILFILCS